MTPLRDPNTALRLDIPSGGTRNPPGLNSTVWRIASLDSYRSAGSFQSTPYSIGGSLTSQYWISVQNCSSHTILLELQSDAGGNVKRVIYPNQVVDFTLDGTYSKWVLFDMVYNTGLLGGVAEFEALTNRPEGAPAFVNNVAAPPVYYANAFPTHSGYVIIDTSDHPLVSTTTTRQEPTETNNVVDSGISTGATGQTTVDASATVKANNLSGGNYWQWCMLINTSVTAFSVAFTATQYNAFGFTVYCQPGASLSFPVAAYLATYSFTDAGQQIILGQRVGIQPGNAVVP